MMKNRQPSHRPVHVGTIVRIKKVHREDEPDHTGEAAELIDKVGELLAIDVDDKSLRFLVDLAPDSFDFDVAWVHRVRWEADDYQAWKESAA